MFEVHQINRRSLGRLVSRTVLCTSHVRNWQAIHSADAFVRHHTSSSLFSLLDYEIVQDLAKYYAITKGLRLQYNHSKPFYEKQYIVS